MTGRWSCV